MDKELDELFRGAHIFNNRGECWIVFFENDSFWSLQRCYDAASMYGKIVRIELHNCKLKELINDHSKSL